jgi:hypothetical protein
VYCARQLRIRVVQSPYSSRSMPGELRYFRDARWTAAFVSVGAEIGWGEIDYQAPEEPSAAGFATPLLKKASTRGRYWASSTVTARWASIRVR